MLKNDLIKVLRKIKGNPIIKLAVYGDIRHRELEMVYGGSLDPKTPTIWLTAGQRDKK